MPSISEKTFIPLGVAVLVLGGGGFWASARSSKIEELQTNQQRIIESYNQIQSTLIQIQIEVALLSEQIKRLDKTTR